MKMSIADRIAEKNMNAAILFYVLKTGATSAPFHYCYDAEVIVPEAKSLYAAERYESIIWKKNALIIWIW